MRKGIFILGLVFLGILLITSAHGQWARVYGGGNDDCVLSIQQTKDGGYIVAGYTKSFGDLSNKVWILKFDSNGKILWQKIYFRTIHYDTDEVATSIQQTKDGKFVVAGWSDVNGEGDYPLAFKVSSTGEIEWGHCYGYCDPLCMAIGRVYSIQQLKDGKYIAVGKASWRMDDVFVAKLDSNGNPVWHTIFGGNHNDSAYRVQQTKDGGYAIAGYTYSFGAGDSDFLFLKLNSTGNIQIQKAFGGSGKDYAECIQQTSDGGYIIAGSTNSFGAGSFDFWVIKLNSSGNIEWQKTYGGTKGDYAHSIQQTEDGGYIVAGSTWSFGKGKGDFWVIKLDANGNIEWERTYGGIKEETAWCVQQTKDEGYVVAGRTKSFGEGGDDIFILKLDSNGDIDPSCGFIGSSNAQISNTSISPRSASFIEDYIPHFDTESSRLSPQNSNGKTKLLCKAWNKPPVNISLKREINRSLFRKEAFHTITWSANPKNSGFTIVEYRIYRKLAEESDENYKLIASVPGNVYEYVDGYLDVSKKYVYVLTSVEQGGHESRYSEPVGN